VNVKLKTEATGTIHGPLFQEHLSPKWAQEHVILTGIPNVFSRETSGNRLGAMGTFDHSKRFRLEKGHSATTVGRRCVLNAHFKTLMKVRQLICHG